MEETIKVLEEFIKNYKEVQEKYKDDEIQAEIERNCYFEEVPAKAIETLLQAYKEDEKVIKELAEQVISDETFLYDEGYNAEFMEASTEYVINSFRNKVREENNNG